MQVSIENKAKGSQCGFIPKPRALPRGGGGGGGVGDGDGDGVCKS